MTTHLRTEQITVTPALAEKWLADFNFGNRPLSKHIVKQYAEEMRSGKVIPDKTGPADAPV
jgi:hypothetical protein